MVSRKVEATGPSTGRERWEGDRKYDGLEAAEEGAEGARGE